MSRNGNFNPRLIARARNLMAQASVISEGKTASLAPIVSDDSHDSSIPHLNGTPLLDEIAGLFASVRTDSHLRDACEEAEQMVRRHERSRAQLLLDDTAGESGEIDEAAASDIVCDLLHWLDASPDYQYPLNEIDRAIRHWKAER